MKKIIFALLVLLSFEAVLNSQNIFKKQGQVENQGDGVYLLADITLDGLYKNLTLSLWGDPNGYAFDSLIVLSYIGTDINDEAVFAKIPFHDIYKDSFITAITPDMIIDDYTSARSFEILEKIVDRFQIKVYSSVTWGVWWYIRGIKNN
ncbi:MAG: hypothetical protein IT280_13145 [Ignavibacteria bacterium]|nr:hypothetical protein [Ignavibacteria bacterium]